MPPVVAFVTSAAFLTQLAFTAASFVVSAGLSYYQRKRLAKKNKNRSAELQQNLRQATSPRYYLGGKDGRIGGLLHQWEAKGADMYVCCIISDDIISKINSFHIRGIEVLTTLNDGIYTVNTPPFATTTKSYVQFEVKHGYADQTASTLLTTGLPELYTADHRGVGIAYVVAKITQPREQDFQKVFNSTIPELSFGVDGVLMFDVREPLHLPEDPTTWASSSNPVVNLMHAMTAKYGLGLSRRIFDSASIIAQSDRCDELILTKTKGLRPRYESTSRVSFDEAPSEVIESYLDTFNGDLYINQRGLIAISCDDTDVPEIVIDASMVIEIEAERNTGALFQSTSIKSRFSSEDHAFVENGEEAQQWDDAAAIAAVGRPIPDEFDLRFVSRHDQARRLMKRRFFDLNPEWTVTMKIDFHGIELLGERVFTFVYPMYGINGKFRLESLQDDGGLHAWQVRCYSVNPAAGEFNHVTEEGTAPAIPPAIAEDGAPTLPVGLTYIIGGTTAYLNWSDPPSTMSSECEYKLSSASVWTTATLSANERHTIKLSGLTLAETYDFRVRTAAPNIGVSNWAEITFVVADTVGSVGNIQSLTATGWVLSATGTVKQSASLVSVKVQICVVPGAGAANWTAPQEFFLFPDMTRSITLAAPTVGANSVYARSVDALGNFGSDFGPVSITVTQQVNNYGGNGSDTGSGGTGTNTGGGLYGDDPDDGSGLYGDNYDGGGLY